MGELERPPDRLHHPAHPLRVGVDDGDRAELVERPLGGHGRHVDPLADEREVLRDAERRPVVEDDHRHLLGGRIDAPRHRRRRRRADDVGLADEPDGVRHVPAAAALDVVGVDGPAVDRGDRVLQLGALVQPVGVERDADVVGLGEAQRVVDQLRVRAVVLVDLEPARPGIQEGLQRAVVLGPGARLQADVERPVGGRRRTVRAIAAGGSSKPAVMSVVTPPDSAAGSSSGEMRWTWLSTAPGVAIRP